MTQEIENPTNETATAETKSEVAFGVFGGKYGQAQISIYEFLTENMKLDKAKAHKIAVMFACDYGAAMKQRGVSETKAKVGKATKEGIVTLSEAIKNTAKGVSNTYPMAIAHAVQWLSDAGKHGISYGLTTWQFTPAITTWIEKLEVK